LTVIVYAYNELCADRLVVHRKPVPSKQITHNVETVEDKLIVTPDNQFAYVFNNDQYPPCLESILIYLRLFELGLINDKTPELKFDEEFKLVVMSKRHTYSCVSTPNDDYFNINVIDTDIYIAPDGNYRHYECLQLSALEIAEIISFQDQFICTSDFTVVKRKSLTLIRKQK